MILGGGVAVCLLLSAHRAVIFAIAQWRQTFRRLAWATWSGRSSSSSCHSCEVHAAATRSVSELRCSDETLTELQCLTQTVPTLVNNSPKGDWGHLLTLTLMTLKVISSWMPHRP